MQDRARQVLACETSFIVSNSFRDPQATHRFQQLIERLESESPAVGDPKFPTRNETVAICSSGVSPLLQPKEEADCFLCFNYLKWRANALRSTIDPEAPTESKLSEVEALLRQARMVRDRIISANMRLVMSIAKSLANRRQSFDELFSEGIAPLIRAVEKFDVERGFRFSTYAFTAVRRSLTAYLMHAGERARRWKTCVEPGVLDRTQVDRPSEAPLPDWAVTELRTLLSGLPTRESEIVQARFGLAEATAPSTLQEIGRQKGVSKERVRQLLARALSRLHGMLQSSGLTQRLLEAEVAVADEPAEKEESTEATPSPSLLHGSSSS